MDSLPVSNNYTFDRLHRGFGLLQIQSNTKKSSLKSSPQKERTYDWTQDGESLKFPVQRQVWTPTAVNCRHATPSPLRLRCVTRPSRNTSSHEPTPTGPGWFGHSMPEMKRGKEKRGEDNLFNGLKPASSDSEDVWYLTETVGMETDFKQNGTSIALDPLGMARVNVLILFFPTAHNSLFLPLKFCINYCCEMLLGRCRPPKSI